jgi:hypothetical protein
MSASEQPRNRSPIISWIARQPYGELAVLADGSAIQLKSLESSVSHEDRAEPDTEIVRPVSDRPGYRPQPSRSTIRRTGWQTASSTTRGGVIGVYQRATLIEPMRRVMALWNRLLVAALELQPSAEVVPLRVAG